MWLISAASSLAKKLQALAGCIGQAAIHPKEALARTAVAKSGCKNSHHRDLGTPHDSNFGKY